MNSNLWVVHKWYIIFWAKNVKNSNKWKKGGTSICVDFLGVVCNMILIPVRKYCAMKIYYLISLDVYVLIIEYLIGNTGKNSKRKNWNRLFSKLEIGKFKLNCDWKVDLRIFSHVSLVKKRPQINFSRQNFHIEYK